MTDESVERPSAEKAIVGLATALGHPLRVRILGALASGSSSATRLAEKLDDVDQKDAFYHLRVLAKSDVVELERTRKVRGGTESIFRLKPRASWGKLWEAIPLPALSGWRSTAFRQFVEVAIAALDAGGLDGRDNSTFTAAPITVDRQGFDQLNEAIGGLLHTVDRVEAESRKRLDEGGTGDAIGAIAAAAFFRAPRPARVDGAA